MIFATLKDQPITPVNYISGEMTPAFIAGLSFIFLTAGIIIAIEVSENKKQKVGNFRKNNSRKVCGEIGGKVVKSNAKKLRKKALNSPDIIEIVIKN